MKKLILIAAVLIATATLQSCAGGKNLFNTVNKFVVKHCVEDHVIQPETGLLQIEYTCDSLWVIPAVADKCKMAVLCIDPIHGQISGHLLCSDSTFVFKK